MKILLFSDSHGNTNNLNEAILKNRDVDIVIHLGDYIKDIISVKSQFKDMYFEYVRGNNDYSSDYPLNNVITVENKKILLTHGHNYNVRMGNNMLIKKAKSIGADTVFFGHTHCVHESYEEGIFLLNPGSIALPKNTEKPTYCIVDIRDGKTTSKICLI